VSVATQTSGARLAAAGSSPPSRGGVGWIWTHGVPVVAVLLGLVLRLREYTFNRSLFPDEVTLTHDVVGRTFGQLLHVNPNGQAAPIGWLWTSKVAAVVFGQHDLTLRLVPFLASVAALLLFPYVGRELVGRWAMPAALLLFATSPALIYYTSEAKQYSSDVHVAGARHHPGGVPTTAGTATGPGLGPARLGRDLVLPTRHLAGRSRRSRVGPALVAAPAGPAVAHRRRRTSAGGAGHRLRGGAAGPGSIDAAEELLGGRFSACAAAASFRLVLALPRRQRRPW